MAATDLNTVRSTIEARLATELASNPVIPVVFNNMAFDSTTEDTFVQCQTSFGSGSYTNPQSTTSSSANDNSTTTPAYSFMEDENLDKDMGEHRNKFGFWNAIFGKKLIKTADFFKYL